MNKQVRYSIKLQDFPSFQFYEGAKEFMEKFKAYELEYSYYLFDLKEEIWKEAEKTLASKQLQFSKSYEIELSLSEMATYPAFNLIIPSIYDILIMGVNGSKAINSEELKETPFAVDFGSNIKIFKKSVAEIIERLGIKLDFVDSVNVKDERYFLINDFPELKIPRVFKNVSAIKENGNPYANTYYAEGWDGRSIITEEGIQFINQNHICNSYLFSFQEKIYKQNIPNYIISGKFAYELKNRFDEQIQLIPITFDHV